MVSHSDVPAAASRRAWNGSNFTVTKEMHIQPGYRERQWMEQLQTGRKPKCILLVQCDSSLYKTAQHGAASMSSFCFFFTCNSSSSEQLQRPQPSVLICQLLLGVGIDGEVDGGEGNVTQETSFGSLIGKWKIKKRSCIITGLMNEQRQQWSKFVFGIKWHGSWFILTCGGL